MFKHLKKLRAVAARAATPTVDMALEERNRYAGKVLWAALLTHQYMGTLMAQTMSQSVHYQETVMLHVVENFMSLSKYDALKEKTVEYDRRLNRLEQLAKVDKKK